VRVTGNILVGRSLGPYVIERTLGGGGMATVYQGAHRALGVRRAIKVMSSSLATHDSFVQLFYREARLAAGLRHPNIVQIFDIGAQDGLHYLVMELLAGRSLRTVVQEDGPLPLDRVARLIGQLAIALDHAHRQGIAHRDVKAANAFVGPTDQVTLVDFGIARAADATHLTVTHGIGTPEYMAPEVFDEELAPPDADYHALGIGTDLYALGVVAYELVTGTLPFVGRTPQAIAYAQVNRLPIPPSQLRPELPGEVEAVLLRQLAKRPDGRYRPAREFALALAEAVQAAGLVDGGWVDRLRTELDRADAVAAELAQHAVPAPIAATDNPFGPFESDGAVGVAADVPGVDITIGPGDLTEHGDHARAAGRRRRRPRAGAAFALGQSPRSAWRRRWLLPAGRLAIMVGVVAAAAVPATPFFSPILSPMSDLLGSFVDPSGAAQRASARGASSHAVASVPAPTALPTVAPPTPTDVPPTSVPTPTAPSVALAPAPGPTVEQLADEAIAQARVLIGEHTDADVEAALDKLELLYRKLDPDNTRRPELEELLIRGLLKDGDRLRDAAFVLKTVDEGRASRTLLGTAVHQVDRAADLRPNDTALQDQAKKSREQLSLTSLWVDFDAAYRARQNDAQIAALSKIMAVNPDYRTPEGPAKEKLYAAWISKAQESWTAKDQEEARQALQQALTLDPNHPKARELQAAWFEVKRVAPVQAAQIRAAAARYAPAAVHAIEAAPAPAPEPAPVQARPMIESEYVVEGQGSVDSNQSSNSN
jgi:serine/threonine-protein kinase